MARRIEGGEVVITRIPLYLSNLVKEKYLKLKVADKGRIIGETTGSDKYAVEFDHLVWIKDPPNGFSTDCQCRGKKGYCIYIPKNHVREVEKLTLPLLDVAKARLGERGISKNTSIQAKAAEINWLQSENKMIFEAWQKEWDKEWASQRETGMFPINADINRWGQLRSRTLKQILQDIEDKQVAIGLDGNLVSVSVDYAAEYKDYTESDFAELYGMKQPADLVDAMVYSTGAALLKRGKTYGVSERTMYPLTSEECWLRVAEIPDEELPLLL